jgi:hypothetical protein
MVRRTANGSREQTTTQHWKRPWNRGTPASVDGQNRAPKPLLPFHPSGEP